MTKLVKISTGFLGFSMLMFGMLKFVDPFKRWYTAQIVYSELPFQTIAFWSGQFGEILVGAIFLIIVFFTKNMSPKIIRFLFVLGNTAIIIMMLGAFYVHNNLNVPADVLPLKIKPPYIPGFFMLLAIINICCTPRFLKAVSK